MINKWCVALRNSALNNWSICRSSEYYSFDSTFRYTFVTETLHILRYWMYQVYVTVVGILEQDNRIVSHRQKILQHCSALYDKSSCTSREQADNAFVLILVRFWTYQIFFVLSFVSNFCIFCWQKQKRKTAYVCTLGREEMCIQKDNIWNVSFNVNFLDSFAEMC